jgi:outer membrane protein assembly factor BamB
MMKLSKFNLGAFALGLLVALSTRAFGAGSDWPQWRGPNRDGKSTETGLLKQWPPQGPPLLWKNEGVGAGYSGVSIVGGKVFTVGDATDASFIYALDEATGKQLWAAKVGKPGGGGGYPGPRGTPTVDGNLVFALGQFGDLVCVDAATGKERWHKNLPADFHGRMMSDWGYSESPLVDGAKLLCTPGGSEGTMLALNKETGAVLWRAREIKDSAAYSSIIVAEIAGQRQYIQLTDASVFGVAADSGKVLWRAPRPGRTAVIPTPIFHDDCVYVSSGYGVGCNLFHITSTGGQFEAKPVYANKVMVNHHGGVVLVDDKLYGYSDGKGWVCQDFKTGAMVWNEKGQLGKGAILYADGRFYLRSEDSGRLELIEASAQGYKRDASFDQPNRSEFKAWPHLVIDHGRLYVRDQGVLLCYGVKP